MQQGRIAAALGVIAITTLLAFLPCVHAGDGLVPVKRAVLAVYDSSQGVDAETNLFRLGLQMPANHLGCTTDYLDLARQPLPGDEVMQQYRGVISVFVSDEITNAAEYLRWLLKHMKNGVRLIVLGYPGTIEAGGQDVDPKLPKQVFAALGLDYAPGQTTASFSLRYDKVDHELAEFERKLPEFPPMHINIRPAGEAEAWVSVSRDKVADSSSSVVAVTNHGAFALSGYIYWQDPVTFKRQWYLDPFTLLRKGLGLQDHPALTPTTLNGLRAAFSHIDADGFTGWTEVDKHKNCAEVIRDEILKKYDVPITASVIVAEVDPENAGTDEPAALARDIFSLPNIEPASHSWTHPFYWRPELRTEEVKEYELNAFTTDDYSLNAEREIVESAAYITRKLCPPGKPCRITLWTGDCRPTAQQIAISDKAGLLNMNGGDTVMDAERNSLFNVAPLYRNMDGRHQIFTGQANENILTDLWTGPFFGFRSITTTMARTGFPRRISPIDIYYHFYSAEKIASLQALKDVYDWALKQPVAWMFTSDYIRMVQGFIKAKCARARNGAWIVSDYGDCLTVRFDRTDRIPDLSRCRNVLGFDRQPEGLFVHLKPGTERAVIALGGADTINDTPHLKRATGRISEIRSMGSVIQVDYSGWGTGEIVLGGLKPGTMFHVDTGKRMLKLVPHENGELRIPEVTTRTLELVRQ